MASPRLRLFIVFFFMIGLAACSFAPKGEPVPAVTFDHLEPIPVAVQNIHVENIYEGENDAFVMPPEAPMESYIQNRFKAAGAQNILNIIIEEASVKHQHEQSAQSFARFWDIGGTEHYDVTLRLRLQRDNGFGDIVYGTVLKAERQVKVSEHLSIAEREQAQLHALEQLFDSIDQNIQRIVLDDMNLAVR